MLIGRIANATRVMHAPADMENCQPLAICDIDIEGNNVMLSAWLPTPEEVALMQAGQPVYLYIWGTSHPPVFVSVKRDV